MIGDDLLNWLLDFFMCFAVFIFLFILKIILVVCRKNFRITLKELVNNFMESLEDGQASLLVVTYCISSVRSMYSMNYVRGFREFIIILLSVILVYNVIFYTIIKENVNGDEGFARMLKLTSLVFLLLSTICSFLYMLVQMFF